MFKLYDDTKILPAAISKWALPIHIAHASSSADSAEPSLLFPWVKEGFNILARQQVEKCHASHAWTRPDQALILSPAQQLKALH